MIKIILDELKKILICIACMWIIMIAIFAIIGQFNYTIILGLLLGSVFTVLNFALLGTAVEKALIRVPKAAKGYMTMHYFIRYFLAGVVIFIGFKAPYLNGLCVCVPIFAPKITYYSIGFYQAFFKRKGG